MDNFHTKKDNYFLTINQQEFGSLRSLVCSTSHLFGTYSYPGELPEKLTCEKLKNSGWKILPSYIYI